MLILNQNTMKKSDITQFILSYGLHLIIGLGLIIRLTFYISLEPWNENLIDKTLNMSDEIEYHNVALDLEQKDPLKISVLSARHFTLCLWLLLMALQTIALQLSYLFKF